MITAIDMYAYTFGSIMCVGWFISGFLLIYGWKQIFKDFKFWFNFRHPGPIRKLLIGFATIGPLLLAVSFIDCSVNSCTNAQPCKTTFTLSLSLSLFQVMFLLYLAATPLDETNGCEDPKWVVGLGWTLLLLTVLAVVVSAFYTAYQQIDYGLLDVNMQMKWLLRTPIVYSMTLISEQDVYSPIFFLFRKSSPLRNPIGIGDLLIPCWPTNGPWHVEVKSLKMAP